MLLYRLVKYWVSYFVTVVFLSLFFSILYWYLSPNFLRANQEVTSPVPEFLSLLTNNQVRLLDLWKPAIKTLGFSDISLASTAKSALMYDLNTEKTLFEKNPKEKLPMASLTKIMTAIIALENPKADNSYVVHEDDLVGEDTMGLAAGEVLTLEELLYGLLLNSGNDASEVIAANYEHGRQAFITAMNDKAKALDLKDTRFSNPSGLQGDGVQYTTAADLLVMTKYALENFPIFGKIVATAEYSVPATSTHKEYYLFNETNLLTTYPGVKGVKTGFTPEAGLCLVTYLEYKDKRIIGILLNSQNRRQEMKELLDYSLRKLGTKPPPHS